MRSRSRDCVEAYVTERLRSLRPVSVCSPLHVLCRDSCIQCMNIVHAFTHAPLRCDPSSHVYHSASRPLSVLGLLVLELVSLPLTGSPPLTFALFQCTLPVCFPLLLASSSLLLLLLFPSPVLLFLHLRCPPLRTRPRICLLLCLSLRRFARSDDRCRRSFRLLSRPLLLSCIASCVRRSCFCFRVGDPAVYTLCDLFYCTVSNVSATIFDTIMCAMFSDSGVLLRGSGGFNGVNGGSTGRSPVLRPVCSPWDQDLFPCFDRHFSGERAGTPELSIIVPPQHAPRAVTL